MHYIAGLLVPRPLAAKRYCALLPSSVNANLLAYISTATSDCISDCVIILPKTSKMVIKVTTIKGDNVDLKKLPRGSLAYCQLEAYKAYADKKALVSYEREKCVFLIKYNKSKTIYSKITYRT